MADIDQDAWAFKAWLSNEKALNFQTSEFKEQPSEHEISLFPSGVDQAAALIVLRAGRVPGGGVAGREQAARAARSS